MCPYLQPCRYGLRGGCSLPGALNTPSLHIWSLTLVHDNSVYWMSFIPFPSPNSTKYYRVSLDIGEGGRGKAGRGEGRSYATRVIPLCTKMGLIPFPLPPKMELLTQSCICLALSRRTYKMAPPQGKQKLPPNQ